MNVSESDDPYLGVSASVSGRRWARRAFDERAALAMSQRFGVSSLLGDVLSARGVGPENADGFLNPALRTAMPDPHSLQDMEKGAARLAAAIIEGEAIAIFGDYDVDGTTASAILALYLKALGAEAMVHLPDRMTEGYGPSSAAFRALKDKGADLLVTVDCGAAAHEPLATAAEIGLDVIVVDHHQMGEAFPPAAALINPNRPDDISGLTNLSAAGVAFMLAAATSRALRAQGFFEARAEPNLLQYLDLAALGLVCDVMPLMGLARAMTAQGLKVLARRENIGLAALNDVAGAKGAPSAYHLGFLLGPRINAGGRVAHPQLGFDLLTTDDPETARRLAARLNELNAERQAIEREVLEAAMAQAAEQDGPVIVVHGQGWHPGVVGIVAGRLKEAFGRPAIVIGVDGEGTGKGSGRSLTGVDLGAAVSAARDTGLLIAGGGHAMAAGLTIAEGAIEAFAKRLNADLADEVSAARAAARLRLDGLLSVRAATTALTAELEKAGPFGAGNAEPVFALRDVEILRPVIRGERHVACEVSDGAGGRLRAIAFRCVGEPLGEALLGGAGRRLHIAGKLRPDDYSGGVQLHIADAAFAA